MVYGIVWKPNDHKFFLVFSFFCLCVYTVLIVFGFYGWLSVGQYWMVPCGMGWLSFVMFFWAKKNYK